MRSEVIRELHDRYERIERAYAKALSGRNPAHVRLSDVVTAIYAAVPDATPKEIVNALEHRSGKQLPLFSTGEPDHDHES